MQRIGNQLKSVTETCTLQALTIACAVPLRDKQAVR